MREASRVGAGETACHRADARAACGAGCLRDGQPVAHRRRHAAMDGRGHGGEGRRTQRRAPEPRWWAHHLCRYVDLVGGLGDAGSLWRGGSLPWNRYPVRSTCPKTCGQRARLWSASTSIGWYGTRGAGL